MCPGAEDPPPSSSSLGADAAASQCSQEPVQDAPPASNEHGETPSLPPPEPGEDDECIEIIDEDEGDTPAPTIDEGDDDWISDISDTDEEDVSPTPPGQRPMAAGGNPNPNLKKRQAGHGSQRVKNKAKKSDVKKLWQEAGWDPKPAWLTWRAALQWLQGGGTTPPVRDPSRPRPRGQSLRRCCQLINMYEMTKGI